jgi:hypothetical protein
VKRAAALLCALMIVPRLAAAEKWFDWYNKGVAAVRGNQYRDGADALQRAIAEMPNESTSVRAGNVIITYVPHFWLGIARYNLGDVDGALRELKTSEEQGAVQNTQYFGSLREWVARANSQKQHNAETGAAESRKTANAAMGRALDGQAEALSAGADRSDSYRAALRKLQEALETFNKAGTDVGAYRHASDLAGQARELFTASADAAKKEKASRPPPVTAKPSPPKPQPREFVVPFPVDETPPPKTQTTPVTQTTIPKSEPPKVQPPRPVPVKPVPQPPTPVPPPAEVLSETLVSARLAVQVYKRHLLDARLSAREAQTLERQLEGHPNEGVIARVKGQVEQGEKALAAKAVKPVTPPVPVPVPGVSPLEPAWRAFATGDLGRADALLSDLVSAGPTADAYMLRGCTRWTRAALARNGDVSTAESDFRAALKLNRSLRLDPAAFSPKLIAFFEQIRRGI